MRREHKDLSLFQGLSGDLLLLNDLYIITGQKRFKDLLSSNTDYIINNIDTIDCMGLSRGICGILYALLLIKDIEPFDINQSVELDDIIWTNVLQAYHKGDYDLQSGLIGYGLYYLCASNSDSNKKDKVKHVCQLICNLMKKTGQVIQLPYCLESHPFFSSKSIWTNNGFLHGINSVIAFFLICIKCHISDELIINTVNALLEQEYSFYTIEDPSYPMAYGFDENGLHLDKRPTKLYYCTGDYGITANFMNAYEIFNNNKYLEYAKKSYERIIYRLENGERNNQLCFCHGLATNVYFTERFKVLSSTNSFAQSAVFSDILTRELKNYSKSSILDGANGIIMTLISRHSHCSLERLLLLK